jgi:flagellar biosynthetic protein FliR
MMNTLQPLSFDWIWSVLWSLFRIGGFFVTAPFWGHRVVPAKIKIAIVLALGLAVGPIISAHGAVQPESIWRFAAWGVREVIIGGLLGFCFATLFYGVRMAGDLVSLQMGFAIVNAIDPNSAAQVSLIGEFKYIIAILFFLTLNGHHMLISALVDTYRVIPIGGGIFGADLLERLGHITAAMFVTAVKIGTPLMITLLLTDVALGIVARTVPQMNIFIVGFPLKIGIGLFMLGAGLPFLTQVFGRALIEIQTSTQHLIGAMAHP